MNKIIPTADRLFMAVVGPSGSGKTQLVFNMILGHTFEPAFDAIYYFYKEWQPIYDKVLQLRRKNIQFLSTIDFDLIKNLENCLLVFDDSCEEIFNSKDFSDLATSGRHKKRHVIYIKHNLYHQSKYSRTIDLNTTHVVLFKSPRDIQQIKVFGKQLNNFEFLQKAYLNATEQTFGHLLIDLDPKTSDGLRYCSRIVDVAPSIFYLPTSKAVITPINNERERSLYARALVKSSNKKTKTIPPLVR